MLVLSFCFSLLAVALFLAVLGSTAARSAIIIIISTTKTSTTKQNTHTHTHPYKPSQPNTRGHIFLHGSEPFACFLIGIFACLLFPTTSHHTDTNTTSDNRQPQWSISRLLRPLWPPWEPPLRKYTIIIITDNNIKNHRSAPVITTTTKTLGNPELEVNNGGCGRIFTGNLYGRGNARRKPFAGT